MTMSRALPLIDRRTAHCCPSSIISIPTCPFGNAAWIRDLWSRDPKVSSPRQYLSNRQNVVFPAPWPIGALPSRESGDQMIFRPLRKSISRTRTPRSDHIQKRLTQRRGSVRPGSGLTENGTLGKRSGKSSLQPSNLFWLHRSQELIQTY
jgi:hypothetical protein